MYEPPKSDISMPYENGIDKLFNFVVLLSLALTIIFWIYPFISQNFLSEDQLYLLSFSGSYSIVNMGSYFYYFLGIFYCSINVGLFFRFRIARLALFLSIFFGTSLTLLSGYSILTAIESVMSGFLSLLDGIILTFAYFTSVSDSFKKGK